MIPSESTEGDDDSKGIKKALKLGLIITFITAAIIGLRPFFVKSLTPDYPLLQILPSYYFYAFVLLLLFKPIEMKYLNENNKAVAEEENQISFKRKAGLIFLAILFGHLGSTPIHYLALSMNDAISTEVIQKTITPIMVLLFAVYFTKQEKMSKRKFWGILLMVGGALAVISAKKAGPPGAFPMWGKVVAFLSTFAFLGSDIMNKKLAKENIIKKYDYLLIAYGVGFLVVATLWLLIGGGTRPIFNFWILGLAVINVSAWLGKLLAAKYLEASRIRGLIASAPVVTVVIAIFWYATVPEMGAIATYLIAFTLIYMGLSRLASQSVEETQSTLSVDQKEGLYQGSVSNLVPIMKSI